MVSCPICSRESSFLGKDFLSGKNLYRLFGCHACHLNFWEPRKIFPEYYETLDDTSSAYLIRHSGIYNLQFWHLYFLRRFHPRKETRILDVGCGDASFILYCHTKGAEVFGVDFDKKSLEAARNKLDSERLFYRSLSDFVLYAKPKGLRFDIITCFEVLEHQDEPGRFLEDIRSLLKPGGWLIGSVPNRDRFLVNGSRRAGDGDFPPHHFLWFSEDSLLNALNGAGFIPQVHVIPWTPEAMAEVLQILLAGSFLRNLRMRTFRKLDMTRRLEVSGRSRYLNVFIFLKKFLQLPFYPVAFFIARLSAKKGPNLYFEARLPGRLSL